MSLPKIVLAGTAALALSLSLGACSLSVNGSGSCDSGSPSATQAVENKHDKQTETKNVDSIGPAKTDSQSPPGASS